MDMSTAFESRHLSAADIGDKRFTLKIDRVVQERMSDGIKHVMYFHGAKKGLVLNKTNATALIHLLGTAESDHWPGAIVTLYTETVDYNGQSVLGIRIALPDVSRRTETPAPPSREPGEDDIPF